MELVLFEDEHSEDLWPANLTRPTMELRTAASSALEIARSLDLPVRALVRPYLQEMAAHLVPVGGSGPGPRLYVNAALVPRLAWRQVLRDLAGRRGAHALVSGGRVCAARLPGGVEEPARLGPATVTAWLLEAAGPGEETDLRLVRYPFDLVRAHMEHFAENLGAIVAEGEFGRRGEGVYVRPGARVAASAVLDGSDGPIVIEEDVQIGEFAYVTGPALIGRGSRLTDRASLKDGVALSPVCKVGGEVECSTFMPYANKQHHGFIGHAFIGSWVNMGAGTSNSDLKNTYGLVRVEHKGGRLDTGMQFLGCVIGDFSKTAINSSIFTGKVIGVASMVYGFVTRNVPSFCNWAQSFGEVTECPVEVVAATQKRMFARRGVEQTEADLKLLRHVFDLTRSDRMIASEPPQL